MRLRRRKPDAAELTERKPYLVTIHAAGDQWHTFAMGPGDGVGVAGIRVDIDPDGGIQVSPVEATLTKEGLAREIQDELERQVRRPSAHR